MEVPTHSSQETKELAFKIANKISKGSVLARYGELGSGKTTFTRYLVEALGLKSRVQSPTFVIARRYVDGDMIFNHIDLYRLTSRQEAEEIGIEDYLNNKNCITVIEWPEIIEELLPLETIRIFFEHIDENGRKIKIQNLH
jgi:tRNA threonylcarbamoyladenosine biosynthesis protein TsaE